jgi:hypothetical protein
VGEVRETYFFSVIFYNKTVSSLLFLNVFFLQILQIFLVIFCTFKSVQNLASKESLHC